MNGLSLNCGKSELQTGLFDERPFQFLADNLSSAELMAAVEQIPHNINQYLLTLHVASLQGDKALQENVLHKLASYGGQFGLAEFSRLAAQYEQDLPAHSDEYCEALQNIFNESMRDFKQHIDKLAP